MDRYLIKKLGNILKKVGNYIDNLDEISIILLGMFIIGAYFLGFGLFIIIGG